MRPRLTAALALGLLALALPSAAQAEGFTKKSLSIDVVTGPGNDVPCTITADLYTPDGASKDNPAPAVMATNGFGGSKSEFQTLGPSYAKRGFVFLAYSGLGFGGSGCKIELDDPDYDGKAGSQLLSFLGGSKAAKDGTKIDYVVRDSVAQDGSRRSDDPRVGMIGGSYGGQIQFSIAGQDPRLDAIVPQITWNDLSYSLAPNNTDLQRGVTSATPGVLKLDWPVLFTAVGIANGAQAIGMGDASHVGSCPNFDDRVCTSLLESAARGYPSQATQQFLRHASVSSYIDRIRIPTLLAQGQSDNLFNLQEATATYQALRGQGTPVKMLWRSSGHSGGGIGAAENNQAAPEAGYESRMELEWLNYYLRGVGEPPKLDFSFLTDWLPYSGDAAPAVGSTPSYPAGTGQRLYLSGTDALVGAPAEVKPGTAPFLALPVAPTSTGGGLLDTTASDVPVTSAAFSSPPLDDDLDVAGIPSLQVRIDAPSFALTQAADPGAKLVLFAKLYDVDPAGKATLPRNLISAVRVSDVTKPVRIDMPGIVHRFAKGHRLRLVLATSSLAYRGNTGVGPVTVSVDPASPSTLTIPRLGAPAGPAGSGPSGTTPFTPSADAAPPQAARASGLARARRAGPR